MKKILASIILYTFFFTQIAWGFSITNPPASGAGTGDLLADGSIPLTSDWDAGSHEIRSETFESDVATGTAPFTVASTTVVTNLNADAVDGSSAAAFQPVHAYLTDLAAITAAQGDVIYFDGTDWINLGPGTNGHYLQTQGAAANPQWASVTVGALLADGSVPLTSNWDAGAFEIRAQTLESDVVTGTSPFTIASTTVVTNLNADLLDGSSIGSFYTVGGIDVPIADGGSGASSAAGARANYGLEIGVDIQAFHASLLSIAGLTETNGGMLYGTADNTYAWLAAGTAGYLLQGNGAAAPSWTSSIAISAIDLGPGTLEIPNSDASPSVAGQLRLDTTVVNHASGALRFYDTGTNIKQVIDMVAATAEGCTDDYVVAYDSTLDGFYCKADATGSGSLGTNLSSTTDDITSDNGTILLDGGGANEDLDIDFTTADKVILTSSTGATAIQGLAGYHLGATGIKLTGATGDLTISGEGGGQDETLTFNFNDTANEVGVSSGSGVTTLNMGTIGVSTTGIIKGRAEYGTDISGATAHDTTELHGVFYHFTAAATVTLDAAADAGFGAQACYRVRDAAEAAVIDLDAAEKFNLAGTALAAGVAITATGAGEMLCVVATTDTDGSGTDGYEIWGPTSGWASE